MNIIIIPARAGSKRIPKKNIKDFKGKPIIERIIKKVIKIKYFQKIIVSTDNDEIAEISKKSGALVPFLRPKSLSDDFTPAREVIIHALDWYKEKGTTFDKVCCIFPTSILLKKEDLVKGLDKSIKSKDDSYVFSATSFSHPIQRAFNIKKGISNMINPENFNERTQDLIPYYHDAGQFYIASSNTWLNKTNFFENGTPLLIPKWQAVDIDDQEDWERAEIIYEIMNRN